MSTQLVLDDTLDSRREVWHLLHRMHPHKRLAYLKKCCRAVTRNGIGPGPLPGTYELAAQATRCDRADERLTNTVYVDLIQIGANQGLNLLRVALDLESLAKRGQPAFLEPVDLARK